MKSCIQWVKIMKIFSLLLLFLSVNIFAIEITLNKTFFVSSQTDLKETSFYLEMIKTQDGYSDIEEAFGEAIKLVERYKICKGGSYRIYPFKKNNTQLNKGHINFDCKYTSDKEYERIISEVKDIDSELKLGQNGISFVLSEEKKDENNKLLEKEAYQFAYEHKKFIQNTLEKKCEVVKINLSSSNSITPYRERVATMTATVTPPINENVKQSLNVNYTFKCE